MPSNYTPNYQLNQWERLDKVLMEDFNADNVKIDTAIKAVDAKHDAAIAGKGNCQIATGSYTGAGTFGVNAQNKLTFPFKPALVVVTGGGWLSVMIAGAESVRALSGSAYASWVLTWSGNSVSWYASEVRYSNSSTGTVADYTQMNTNTATYHYIVLGAKS